VETSEPVVHHHGREVGDSGPRRGAAVSFNSLLGGARHETRAVCACAFSDEAHAGRGCPTLVSSGAHASGGGACQGIRPSALMDWPIA
jgi:hypothetical protein